MNTRFSPSLNGSLHIGHLWMAWVNWRWARDTGGRFLLRFDDLAPLLAGEDVSNQNEFAAEGECLLAKAGLMPDGVSLVSSYQVPGYPDHAGGLNRWLRPPDLEGWDNVGGSPALVAARVNADIEERIDIVVRGEELTPELQLYEMINHLLGAKPRMLVYLPRLRVREHGAVTTISKTYGNLQLRDLYRIESPEFWLDKVVKAGLIDPNAPLEFDNIDTNPIIEV